MALVSHGNDAQKEGAAGALWSLSTSDENQDEIREAGGIPPLVALAKKGTVEQQKNASIALFNLMCNDECEMAIREAGWTKF